MSQLEPSFHGLGHLDLYYVTIKVWNIYYILCKKENISLTELTTNIFIFFTT